MNQEKIGKFITECRKLKKITQQELANKLGVTDKAISKWENGRGLMDISLLKPLSDILDVSIVELLNGEKINNDEIYQKSENAIEVTLKYAKNSVKKSKIKYCLAIVLAVILITALCFYSYKLIMHHRYTVEPLDNYQKISENLSFSKELKIYKRTINEEEYLIENEIKIRNDFSNFSKIENSGDNQYILKNENDELEAFFSATTSKTYIDIFTKDFFEVTVRNNITTEFNDDDRMYFLLKNDINTDIDFIEYIKNNYYLEIKIFESTREMKEKYALNSFVQVGFSNIERTTLITGDYSGFIFDLTGDVREVHILRNDKAYIFTLYGEDFTSDEYISDLLSTLEIQ